MHVDTGDGVTQGSISFYAIWCVRKISDSFVQWLVRGPVKSVIQVRVLGESPNDYFSFISTTLSVEI